VSDDAVHRPGIAARYAVEAAVEAAREPIARPSEDEAGTVVRIVRLEEKRTERW
jgi:hypothetical protein